MKGYHDRHLCFLLVYFPFSCVHCFSWKLLGHSLWYLDLLMKLMMVYCFWFRIAMIILHASKLQQSPISWRTVCVCLYFSMFFIFLTKFSVSLLLICNSDLLWRTSKWLSTAQGSFLSPVNNSQHQDREWLLGPGSDFFTPEVPVLQLPMQGTVNLCLQKCDSSEQSLGRGQIHFVMKHFSVLF